MFYKFWSDCENSSFLISSRLRFVSCVLWSLRFPSYLEGIILHSFCLCEFLGHFSLLVRPLLIIQFRRRSFLCVVALHPICLSLSPFSPWIGSFSYSHCSRQYYIIKKCKIFDSCKIDNDVKVSLCIFILFWSIVFFY